MAQVYLVFKNYHSFTRITKNLTPLQFSVDVFDTFKRVVKRIIILHLITVIATIPLGGYVWSVMTDIYGMNGSERILLVIINAFINIISVFPPISSGKYISLFLTQS